MPGSHNTPQKTVVVTSISYLGLLTMFSLLQMMCALAWFAEICHEILL